MVRPRPSTLDATQEPIWGLVVVLVPAKTVSAVTRVVAPFLRLVEVARLAVSKVELSVCRVIPVGKFGQVANPFRRVPPPLGEVRSPGVSTIVNGSIPVIV